MIALHAAGCQVYRMIERYPYHNLLCLLRRLVRLLLIVHAYR